MAARSVRRKTPTVVRRSPLGYRHVGSAADGHSQTPLDLFAYPMMRLGSVYPSMAAHFVIDVLLFAWLAPKLLRESREPENASASSVALSDQSASR